MSITAKAARQKGKDLEDYVADQIVALGIDPRARRDGASGAGNREKGDIQTSMMVLGQNVGIECKHTSTILIQEWWRQTKKMESLSREPVLVFKQTNDTYEGTRVVIYLDTFLRLAKLAEGKQEVFNPSETQDDRNLRYKLDNLKRAIGEVTKLL